MKKILIIFFLLSILGCERELSIESQNLSGLPYSFSFSMSPADGTDYGKSGTEKVYKLFLKEAGNVSLDNYYQFYFSVPPDRSAKAEVWANGKMLNGGLPVLNDEKLYFKYGEIFNKATDNEIYLKLRLNKPDIGTYKIGFSMAAVKYIDKENTIVRTITILP